VRERERERWSGPVVGGSARRDGPSWASRATGLLVKKEKRDVGRPVLLPELRL
jgi:hypothetical protein